MILSNFCVRTGHTDLKAFIQELVASKKMEMSQHE